MADSKSDRFDEDDDLKVVYCHFVMTDAHCKHLNCKGSCKELKNPASQFKKETDNQNSPDLEILFTDSTVTENKVTQGDRQKQFLVSGLTGKDLYLCGKPHCEYQAATESQLSDHMHECDLSHKGVIQCRHCFAYFKSIRILINHLSVHGGQRYSCALCAYCGTAPTVVEQHLNHHHKVSCTEIVPVDPSLETDMFIVQPKFQVKVLPKHEPTEQTKVCSNMKEHLGLHFDQDVDPADIPTVEVFNPVVHHEKILHKMPNLAASSYVGVSEMSSSVTSNSFSPALSAALPLRPDSPTPPPQAVRLTDPKLWERTRRMNATSLPLRPDSPTPPPQAVRLTDPKLWERTRRMNATSLPLRPDSPTPPPQAVRLTDPKLWERTRRMNATSLPLPPDSRTPPPQAVPLSDPKLWERTRRMNATYHSGTKQVGGLQVKAFARDLSEPLPSSSSVKEVHDAASTTTSLTKQATYLQARTSVHELPEPMDTAAAVPSRPSTRVATLRDRAPIPGLSETVLARSQIASAKGSDTEEPSLKKKPAFTSSQQKDPTAKEEKICKACGKAFKGLHGLKMHIIQKHKHSVKWRCGYCHQEKASRKSISQHCCTKHPGLPELVKFNGEATSLKPKALEEADREAEVPGVSHEAEDMREAEVPGLVTAEMAPHCKQKSSQPTMLKHEDKFLIHHRSMHHPDIEQKRYIERVSDEAKRTKFECKKCCFTTDNFGILNEHLQIHISEFNFFLFAQQDFLEKRVRN